MSVFRNENAFARLFRDIQQQGKCSNYGRSYQTPGGSVDAKVRRFF
jgi:hypothetical protein